MKSEDNSGNKFGDNLKSYPEFILDYPLQKMDFGCPIIAYQVFVTRQKFRPAAKALKALLKKRFFYKVLYLPAIAIPKKIASNLAPHPQTNFIIFYKK